MVTLGQARAPHTVMSQIRPQLPCVKGGIKAAGKANAHLSEELLHPWSSIKHILAIPSSPPTSRDVVRTAILPVTLSGVDYRRAHDAHHIAAGLWDQELDWVHGEWKAKHNPRKYDIRAFLTSIPREQRPPLHAHTTEAIGYDLYEAIKTSRTNRKNGMRVRSLWRKKNYRPLSFSKHFGWSVRSDNKLNLSLGRAIPGIVLALPNLEDSVRAELASPELWSEIQLCWDQDNRQFSLHIPYVSKRNISAGKAVTAIDGGIINPMALATWVDEKTINVTIINGREARAIKRQRNKAVGALQCKISRCKTGSRKHRRLVAARKRVKGKARLTLRDFDHQVARNASNHVIAHTARLVVGDVRGIEHKTKQKRRIGRSSRQQLSQFSRGVQEKYLEEKTGLDIEYLNESGSTKTCPVCAARNRPSGRYYRCKVCNFTCHRDALGAINILQEAIHGSYVPIGADAVIRVTYLRDALRWSSNQRNTHRMVQCRKAITPSSAKNQASTETSCKPKLANSSISSLERVPLVAVA